MPLRDHFRPPLDDKRSWDELHGMWPAVIVQHLIRTLPKGYYASPGVHLGTIYEVDVAAFSDESRNNDEHEISFGDSEEGSIATAVWAPPQPSLTLQPRLPRQDEYEIRIYDERKDRRLVAAVELISPSNKDRAGNRIAFASKVAALLDQGVCVTLVDVVSTYHFNLYSELLAILEGTDAALGEEPPATYAVTVQCRREKRKVLMDAWYYPLPLGGMMPTLPIWLNGKRSIALELERTYEETCKALRIA